MLDWLIVGGGVHGTHLSLRLTRDAGVAPHRVRVLDPQALPLARWTARARNTGMRYLRSPAPYHLDTDPMALSYHARAVGPLPEAPFLEPYKRPSLALFAAHCGHVVDAHGLMRLRLHGEAQRIRLFDGHAEVETRTGTIAARRVALALGPGDAPCWPAWATRLRAAGAPVRHLFEPGFERAAIAPWRHAVVVGGGISAVQAALALASRQPGCVTLVARHEARVQLLDSDAGWSTPRLLEPFRRQRDFAARRDAIRAARHPGSYPEELAAELDAALAAGRLARVEAPVCHAALAGGEAELAFPDGGRLSADAVILATGFGPERPGGWLVDRLIAEHALPLAPCGYPLVDAALRWHPRLVVMGPLAELEIGPVSRNIVGAQHAAARIAGLASL